MVGKKLSEREFESDQACLMSEEHTEAQVDVYQLSTSRLIALLKAQFRLVLDLEAILEGLKFEKEARLDRIISDQGLSEADRKQAEMLFAEQCHFILGDCESSKGYRNRRKPEVLCDHDLLALPTTISEILCMEQRRLRILGEEIAERIDEREFTYSNGREKW